MTSIPSDNNDRQPRWKIPEPPARKATWYELLVLVLLVALCYTVGTTVFALVWAWTCPT